MIHVVDVAKTPHEYKNDDLLDAPKEEYANCFIPLVVNQKIEANLIVSADRERLESKNFPLEFSDESVLQNFEEDGSLAKEIAHIPKVDIGL